VHLFEKNDQDILEIINITILWTPCSKKNVTFSFNTFFILQTLCGPQCKYTKKMQRVLGFLAIYSGLQNKRAIVRKTKKTEGGISIDPLQCMRKPLAVT
jgi:hypothetical protein